MHMQEAQLAFVVSPEDPKGNALLLKPQGFDFAAPTKKLLFSYKSPRIQTGELLRCLTILTVIIYEFTRVYKFYPLPAQ